MPVHVLNVQVHACTTHATRRQGGPSVTALQCNTDMLKWALPALHLEQSPHNFMRHLHAPTSTYIHLHHHAAESVLPHLPDHICQRQQYSHGWTTIACLLIEVGTSTNTCMPASGLLHTETAHTAFAAASTQSLYMGQS